MLYAIIKLHMAKEEEIYLPLLEVGLTAREMQHMFEALVEAVRGFKGQTQTWVRLAGTILL